MNIIEIIIIAAIVLAAGLIIIMYIRSEKNKKCSGCIGNCQDCGEKPQEINNLKKK